MRVLGVIEGVKRCRARGAGKWKGKSCCLKAEIQIDRGINLQPHINKEIGLTITAPYFFVPNLKDSKLLTQT